MKDKFSPKLFGLSFLVVAVLILLFVGLGSCAPQPVISTAENNDLTITRYIDHDAKVVCWVVLAGSTDNATLSFQPAGMSCLPFSSTALDLGQ